jgi:hypothetical protein
MTTTRLLTRLFALCALTMFAACNEILTPPILDDELAQLRGTPTSMSLDGDRIEITAFVWREEGSPGIEVQARLWSLDRALSGFEVLGFAVLDDARGWEVPIDETIAWSGETPWVDVYSRTDLRFAPTRLDAHPRRDVDIVVHFRDDSGRDWYLRAADVPVQRG